MGGEVQGKVSVVFALFGPLRPQPQQARRQDLADLASRSEGVIRLGSRALLRGAGSFGVEPCRTAFAVDDRQDGVRGENYGDAGTKAREGLHVHMLSVKKIFL